MKRSHVPSLRSAHNSGSSSFSNQAHGGMKSMAPPPFQLKASGGGNSSSAESKGEYRKTRFWRNWEPNKNDLWATLEKFPKGKWAIDVFERHGLTLKFEPGGGSYYQYPSIVIDSEKLTVEHAAMIFVHEANHASYEMEGGTPMAGECSKLSMYMDHRIDEDAEGEVLAIEAVEEMKKEGIKTRELKRKGTYQDYMPVYKAAKKKALKEGKSEAEAKKIARQKAKDALKKQYKGGDYVQSTDSQSYMTTAYDLWTSSHARSAANTSQPSSSSQPTSLPDKCIIDRSKAILPP